MSYKVILSQALPIGVLLKTLGIKYPSLIELFKMMLYLVAIRQSMVPRIFSFQISTSKMCEISLELVPLYNSQETFNFMPK